jgi:hypothetical protein
MRGPPHCTRTHILLQTAVVRQILCCSIILLQPLSVVRPLCSEQMRDHSVPPAHIGWFRGRLVMTAHIIYRAHSLFAPERIKSAN